MEKQIDSILENQIDWLSSLILSGGEFIMSDKNRDSLYKIVPYFSDIACLGLLESSYEVSKIGNYISWYIANINTPDKYGVNGTIYDYHVRKNGELISTKDYDSYDSYPATFLTLCLNYFNMTKNYRFFNINKKKIDSITNSMLASMDSDYLTWAKPNWKIKYLMDNCEVYQGLKDASEFYKIVYNDLEFSEKLLNLAKQNLSAIENKMWNNDAYYYLIDNAGHGSKPNFSKWYPDSTSQLFPILCGVISPNSQRTKDIYNNFNIHNTDWFELKQPKDFPDVYVAYVASLMKDYDRVNSFINLCIKDYIKKGNIWPWYNVECSYFIRTLLNLQKSK